MNAVIIILALLVLFVLWLLLSPLVIMIDTRIPEIKLRWVSIGMAALSYEADVLKLQWRIFFIKKETLLKRNMPATVKKKSPAKKKTKKKRYSLAKMAGKIINVLKSFTVQQWNIALDTGDNSLNAQLYALNYFVPGGHLNINFTDNNYLLLTIKNSGWRIMWAWLR